MASTICLPLMLLPSYLKVLMRAGFRKSPAKIVRVLGFFSINYLPKVAKRAIQPTFPPSKDEIS